MPNKIQRETPLIQKWKEESEETNHREEVKKSVTENWKTTKEIYKMYEKRVESPLTYTAIRTHLNDLQAIGEVEKRESTGPGRSLQWRLCDKPGQIAKEQNPELQERIPEWLENRIEQVVRDKIDLVMKEEAGNRLKIAIEDDIRETMETVLEEEPDFEKKINNKSKDKETIFRILKRDKGYVSMSDIIKRYKKRVENPKSRRTVRRYLEDLEETDLIKSKGKKKGKKYRTK